MCLAVHEFLTTLLALELTLPEYVSVKYVCSTHDQFRLFKNIDCLMSFCKCDLNKAVTLLLCNNPTHCQKGNAVRVSNHLH